MARGWTSFVVIAACAVSSACTLTVNEQRMFHPGPAYTTSLPILPGARVERVTLTADDGAALSGIRIVQPDADTELLYFGGNAARADDMVEYLAPILAGKPHREKTAEDVAEKSKVYRIRAKHLGQWPKSRRPLRSRNSFERRA